MNFGQTERPRYKKFIVPIFGSFLQKCYCKSSQVVHVNYSLTMYNLHSSWRMSCSSPAYRGRIWRPRDDGSRISQCWLWFDNAVSKMIQLDTSSLTLNPTTASLDATSSSCPCNSISPLLLSHANTPLPSPATHSLPNTLPISPARSLLNSPACSSTLNSMIPFSLLELSLIFPTCFPVNSAPIPPTLSHINELPISLPEPSILEPAGGYCHAVMDLELSTMEIRSKKRGQASKKRRGEVENDTPLKRTRPLNTDVTIASGGGTRLSASTSTVAWRGLRSDNQATKQGGSNSAIAAVPWCSKIVGTSAPPPLDHHQPLHLLRLKKTPPCGSPGWSSCCNRNQQWVRNGWS